MRSLMFEQLKNHPRMALVIGKFRNAASSSSKRTSQWLYEKMVEVSEIHQLEENTQSVDKNLSQMGTKVNAAPNKPDKPGRGDKNPKGDKESQPNKPSKPDKPPKPAKPDKPDKGTADVDAAAAKGKGKKGDKSKGDKGKGDKGQTPSPRLTPEEKKKRPCMYYAFNSCSKGASWPKRMNHLQVQEQRKWLQVQPSRRQSRGQRPRLRPRTLHSRGRFGTQRSGAQDLPKIKRSFRRVMCLKKPLKQSQLSSHVAIHWLLNKKAPFLGRLAIKFQDSITSSNAWNPRQSMY